MTDQPNQDSQEESYGSHTPALCRRIGRHGRRYPKDVPAEPGTSNETDDLSREVMSSATKNIMK
jgi:hypothetical protein